MSAERLFFDSNVFIKVFRFPEFERQIEIYLQGACEFVVNKIVLMELWAGARTGKEKRILTDLQLHFPIVGMTDDNFVTAGKILSVMQKKYRFEPRARRTLTWDLLIALSAKENNAVVLTENIKDFQLLQRFVDFEFLRA